MGYNYNFVFPLSPTPIPIRMKTLFLTSLSLFWLQASATVHTVNNNVPSPGQYTSVSAAITAAANGDTIYVSGSPYNYNGFTVNKKLTLIGSGHKPQNTNTTVSLVDNITIASDSVRIIGFKLNRVNGSGVRGNLTVQRCLVIDQVYLDGTWTNVTLEGNVFQSTGTNFNPYFYASFNGVTVKNNIFNGTIHDIFGYYGINNIVVKNNLFLGASSAFSGTTRYVTITNNIFYRANPSNTVSSSDYTNNISYQCANNAFPIGSSSNTGSGNLTNVDPQLVNFPAAGDYFGYTYDYTLQAGSPAANGGSDGKDIGLTGGDGYFQKYGIPPIPQIRDLSIISPANGVVNPGGTLQIKVISTIRR